MSLNKVVLDIPHGGKELPPEVKPHMHPEITRGDLLREADLYSQGFFRQQPDIPEGNKVWFDYFRTIVDTNRDRDDFSSDGIVKTQTIHGKRLYNGDLPEELKRHLVVKYAVPHQERVKSAVERPDTRMVVLCHTMEPLGPLAGIGPVKKRPLINIANGGDKQGNPDPLKPYQAPRDIMEFVKDEIERRITGLNLNGVITDGKAVGINRPFSARKSIDRIGPDRLPGRSAFMIEVNKSLVIDHQTLAERRPENIAAIRKIIHDVLEGALIRLTR